MKITVSCAMKHDSIKASVEAIAEPKLTFVNEKGMDVNFTTDSTDPNVGKLVKRTLKMNKDLQMIYFNVQVDGKMVY